MNINLSSLNTYSASSLFSTSATSSTASSSGTSSASAPAAGDSTRMSPMAKLVAKLQKLEATDPAKAKEVLGKLAAAVRDQAKSATGKDADHMNKLADALQKAADTGDLSGLAPHGGGHRGPPPGAPPAGGGAGMAAYAKTQSQSSDDKGRALMDMLNSTFDSLTSSTTSVSA